MTPREVLERIDNTRRQFGAYLERVGFGPHTTPSRTAHVLRNASLVAYQVPSIRSPAIMLVPAPVKTSYIWDLVPDSSVVRRCLSQGLQVYLVSWSRPHVPDPTLDLICYADTALSRCVGAISAETGQQKIFVAGHSLGGTFAAIFSSLHPEQVRGLIEVEGPMAFGSGAIDSAAGYVKADSITLALDPVPGIVLDWLSSCAAPYSYQIEPLMDMVLSGAIPDAHALHWRIRRWTLDETAVPRCLLQDVIRLLYRENRFARGTLHIQRRIADPRAIGMPILCVAEPHSRIVPLEAIEAYRTCTGSRDVEILMYPGDQGALMQHIGVLVGRNAHKLVWPRILDWIREK